MPLGRTIDACFREAQLGEHIYVHIKIKNDGPDRLLPLLPLYVHVLR